MSKADLDALNARAKEWRSHNELVPEESVPPAEVPTPTQLDLSFRESTHTEQKDHEG
jgi:hypothetical protein